MNKRLLYGCLVLLLIFTSACGNNDNKEILATTEFDGMTVTIYHDPSVMNNNGVYFSNDQDKIPHNITAPTMKNSTNDQMLFVDFRGNDYVLYQDEIIEPVEVYPVQVDNLEWNLTIYHLDPSKQYYKIGKTEKAYHFMTCTSSETARSHVCTGSLDVDYEKFMSMISTWEEVILDEAKLVYSDLKAFLEIFDNKVELNGTRSILTFSKADLENGELIVSIFDTSNKYYRLTTQQKAELEEMIKE